MDFTQKRRPTRTENIVPMINVVFLLLIFFLMTAQITPPDIFEVILPKAVVEQTAEQSDILLIAADGTLGYGTNKDAAALQAITMRTNPDLPLLIRADTALPATTLAALLPKLAVLGITKVELATEVR
jgi:biopolymer transport protein ExbD